MGICLDTEQNNDDVESSNGPHTRGESPWASRGKATPPAKSFPMQNSSHVKFEPPSVPVIFVLGGPGSGKVTHCDNLMQERRGVVHINMTDLLQQYAIGNGTASRIVTDMQDFGTLSSKTVTEVLMLEMKMAPTAKTYLVSGYPRSMRDVAEYVDKIQTLSGVILISWRQKILERQIEYGARLGHVVLSLARMELNNFYKRVMPVADYFDQSNMLIAVNGERNPEEVYKDFRASVLQILGAMDEDLTNGQGVKGIPGEIVGIEPAPSAPIRAANDLVSVPVMAAVAIPPMDPIRVQPQRTVEPKSELIRVRGPATTPIVVFVVGGPGSNKAALCQRAIAHRPGWIHFSLGQRLRNLAETNGPLTSENGIARSAVTGGELAPLPLVTKVVRAVVNDASTSGQGLLLDGFPRDLDQLEHFQREYDIEPRMVLLDCSKLQLGRGRRDDSVAAFRRRLEVFRESTLPMLKNMDQDHRLVIVDGDTDSGEVQDEFTKLLLEEMEKAVAISQIPRNRPTNRQEPNPTMQQFTNAAARMGAGFAGGALPNGNIANGHIPNGHMGNGYIGKNKVNPVNNNISTVSEITREDIKRIYEQSSGDVNIHM